MGKGSGRRPPQIDDKTAEANWARTFSGVTCRGSKVLGTACGNCARCDQEQTPAERDEGGQIMVDYDEWRRLNLGAQYDYRHSFDVATREWAKERAERNRAAGPFEVPVARSLAVINSMRDAYGLEMLKDA